MVAKDLRQCLCVIVLRIVFVEGKVGSRQPCTSRITRTVKYWSGLDQHANGRERTIYSYTLDSSDNDRPESYTINLTVFRASQMQL